MLAALLLLTEVAAGDQPSAVACTRGQTCPRT